MSSRGDEFKIVDGFTPDGARVLDVGHGYGFNALRLRMTGKKLHITGLDTFSGYHEAHKRLNIYDEVILGDCRDMGAIGDKRYDVSYALQVAEHLPQGDAERLLREMERVTNGTIIVSTPDGYHPEDHKTRDGNPESLHRSGYRADYFRARGYQVVLLERTGRLVGLLKRVGLYLRGGYGSMRVIVAWKDTRQG